MFEAMLAADLVQKLRNSRRNKVLDVPEGRRTLTRRRYRQARVGGASKRSILRTYLGAMRVKAVKNPDSEAVVF